MDCEVTVTAGQRNSHVSFYRPVITGQNASGEDVLGAPLLLGSAWVSIRPLRGNENEIDRQRQAEVLFEVGMDHPLAEFTLVRKDYIEWGARRLDITDVEDPNQRSRMIRLYAREFVA